MLHVLWQFSEFDIEIYGCLLSFCEKNSFDINVKLFIKHEQIFYNHVWISIIGDLFFINP